MLCGRPTKTKSTRRSTEWSFCPSRIPEALLHWVLRTPSSCCEVAELRKYVRSHSKDPTEWLSFLRSAETRRRRKGVAKRATKVTKGKFKGSTGTSKFHELFDKTGGYRCLHKNNKRGLGSSPGVVQRPSADVRTLAQASTNPTLFAAIAFVRVISSTEPQVSLIRTVNLVKHLGDPCQILLHSSSFFHTVDLLNG